MSTKGKFEEASQYLFELETNAAPGINRPTQELWATAAIRDHEQAQARLLDSANSLLDIHIKRIAELERERDELKARLHDTQDRCAAWMREATDLKARLEGAPRVWLLQRADGYILDSCTEEGLRGFEPWPGTDNRKQLVHAVPVDAVEQDHIVDANKKVDVSASELLLNANLADPKESDGKE